MCSSILAIEFDQEKFDTDLKCTQWLRASADYSILLSFKGFKLKQVARSLFMSEEGRKVFAWHGNLYQFKNLEIKRPGTTGVLAIHRAPSTEMYSTSDYPPLSERALNRQRARRQNQEAKDKERAERLVEQRLKRKRAKEEKKSKEGKSVLKEDALAIKEKKQKPIKRKAKKSKKAEPEKPKPDAWTAPLENVSNTDPNVVGTVFDTTFADRVDSVK